MRSRIVSAALKKKRAETGYKPTPGDNNQLQVVKRPATLKGKEREVLNVLPLESIPSPRVVSLRPRRRSAGSVPTTRASTSKATSPTLSHIPSKPEPSSPQAESAIVKYDSTAKLTSDSTSESTNPGDSKTPSSSSSSLSATPSPTLTSPSKSSSPPARTTTLPSHPTHSHSITQPHIPSPLSPKQFATTPPSSPTLSPRASPPLDAVDLGPLLGLALPASAISAGYTSTVNTNHSASNIDGNHNAGAARSSPPSSPPMSPISGPSSLSTNAPEGTFNHMRMTIILPTIPSSAAAFLGPFAGINTGNNAESSTSPIREQENQPERDEQPQRSEEQQHHHFIQPFLEGDGHSLSEGGAPTHLSMPTPMNAGINMPMNMGMGMGLPLSVGMGLNMGMPINVTIEMPMSIMTLTIPASESELGFGFQPQEGFMGVGGQQQLGQQQQQSSGGQLGGQQQEGSTMTFEAHQQSYTAPESLDQGTSMLYQPSPPSSSAGPSGSGLLQDQQQSQQSQDQQQPQPQQQQNEPQRQSLPLTMKQQRKLTYPSPTPLELPPRIDRDGRLWSTACKLRVWEISKRYTPDTIRTVVAQEAHAYYEATGVFPIGYNNSYIKKRKRSQHRRNSSGFSLESLKGKSKERHQTLSDLSSSGTSPQTENVDAEAEKDGVVGIDDDDDDFMNEKIYPFELLEDDSLEDFEADSGFPAFGGWDDDDEMAGAGCSDDDDWDDDEDEDETDEDEEIEAALKTFSDGVAAKRAASASPTSPTVESLCNVKPPAESSTGASTSTKLALSGDEPALLSGDEDADGEMEVDIEAYDDPSFNRELSSPTSPTGSASPLSPGESMISSFYIPPVPLQMQYNPVQSWDDEGMQEEPPQLQQQPQTQQQQVEQSQQEFQADSQGQEQFQQQQPVQEEPQQPQPQQHQPPLEIHLPAANQSFFLPPSPILPLPPPRLETVRVAYLRQSELGMKLTGRGTPADRARAQQWATGYKPWTPGSALAAMDDRHHLENGSAKRVAHDEESIDEEGMQRARPRLRLSLQDDTNAGLEKGGSPDQSSSPGLHLSLPSDVAVASNCPDNSMLPSVAFKCVDDGLPFMDDKSSCNASSAAINSPTSDQLPWDLLACFDDKNAIDSNTSAQVPSQPQQHEEHQHHEIVLSSRSSSSSSGFTTPRPGPPSPTSDSMFGMGIGGLNMFDMNFVGSWFSGGDGGVSESANNSSTSSAGEEQQGARTPPMNMAAGPGIESYSPIESSSPATSTSGTSTLSFALG